MPYFTYDFADSTNSPRLHRGLRDYVNRQNQGQKHVPTDQMTAKVKRATQWTRIYDEMGWTGVLLYSWLPKEARADAEWRLFSSSLRENRKELEKVVHERFGDKLRELYVIDEVPDLDKLIRVLKSLEGS